MPTPGRRFGRPPPRPGGSSRSRGSRTAAFSIMSWLSEATATRRFFPAASSNPMFGGSSSAPDLVAYADTGGQLGPGGTDGFARMVVPGDKAGGRYVSNLVTLHAGTAPSLPGTGGGVSSQFTLTGGVATPGTYTLATLMSFPATTLTTTYLSGSSSVTDTFTGVSLWTLLSSAGIVTDAAIKNDILRKYVVAVGSDGYESIFSLGEIDPAFGDH